MLTGYKILIQCCLWSWTTWTYSWWS